jgi:pilus assembly protein FimV
VWQKAVALGRQLDPNNPMFAEGGAPAAAAGAAAAKHVDAPVAPPRVPEPPRAEPLRPADVPPVAVGAAEFDVEHTMDFRLDDDISISPRPAHKVTGDTHSSVDAELDRSALAAPGFSFTPEGERAERDAVRAPEPNIDLEFHLDDAEKPAPMRSAPAAAEPVARAADAPGSNARPQTAIDLDKLDLSFDPERAPFEDPTPSVLDGQWHDAATKLDLAKAYQEMGDVEDAREILQEVLHEGDEQQKGEAGALLQKLG